MLANLIASNTYIKSAADIQSLQKLKQIFATNLKPDGVRNRAYLKLVWDRANDQVALAKNQSYFQSTISNSNDGGKVRNFAVMDNKILELSVIQNMLKYNLEIIKNYPPSTGI